MSARDQDYLEGLGTYYLHRDEVSTIAALEAAAHAAPDDARVWTSWGRRLSLFGPLLGRPNWIEQAAAVLDSAIALDPTNAETVRHRLTVALHRRIPSEVRRYLRLVEELAPSGDDTDAWRWATAQIADDQQTLSQMRARLAALSWPSLTEMGHFGFIEGLPIADVEDAIRQRRARMVKSTDFSVPEVGLLFSVLTARGQVRAALSLADSLIRFAARKVLFSEWVIRQALLEPGVGYDSSAKQLVQSLGKDIATQFTTWYPSSDRSAFCLTHAFQALQGDTTQARKAASRVQRIADQSPLASLRGTRGGSCPDLLHALIESRANSRASAPGLRRLDSLLTPGLFWDRVAPTAAVLLARLQESQQMYAVALATSRRRNLGELDYQVAIWPAVLRIEGRLAATVGDTVGAIRAYSHYLTLRDKPDPGPMANEVAQVRAHLAQLRQAAPR